MMQYAAGVGSGRADVDPAVLEMLLRQHGRNHLRRRLGRQGQGAFLMLLMFIIVFVLFLLRGLLRLP